MSGSVVHLHVHSEYSLLDGACKIVKKGADKVDRGLVARAAELGMPALGLTDHGVMNGAVEHYKACTRARDQADPRPRGVLRRRPPRRGQGRAQPPDAAGGERHRLPQPRQADLGRLPRGVHPRQGERRRRAARALRRGRDRAHRLPAVAVLPPAGRGAPRRRPRATSTTSCRSSAPRTSTSRSRRTGSPSRRRRTRGSSATHASSAGRWSAPPTSTTCTARTTTTTRRCSACRRSRRSSSRS